jgi:hypothetical protein
VNLAKGGLSDVLAGAAGLSLGGCTLPTVARQAGDDERTGRGAGGREWVVRRRFQTANSCTIFKSESRHHFGEEYCTARDLSGEKGS